jgi:hypothetical protein
MQNCDPNHTNIVMWGTHSPPSVAADAEPDAVLASSRMVQQPHRIECATRHGHRAERGVSLNYVVHQCYSLPRRPTPRYRRRKF